MPGLTESRSSRTNPKADWYMWHDAADGEPPNNWISGFGHSAWQWEPQRQQYYYHMFYKAQPDLNWNNRDVRNAMYDMIRDWMKRGVAGFRARRHHHAVRRPRIAQRADPAGRESVRRSHRRARIHR